MIECTECTSVTHTLSGTHMFPLKTVWCDLVWLLKVTLNINGVYSRRAHRGVHLCSGGAQKNDAITAEAGSSMPHSTAAHRKFISCKRKHSVSSSGNGKNEPGTENVFRGSCGERSAPFYGRNFLQTCSSPHFSASISRGFLHVSKFLGSDQNSAGQSTGFQGSRSNLWQAWRQLKQQRHDAYMSENEPRFHL